MGEKTYYIGSKKYKESELPKGHLEKIKSDKEALIKKASPDKLKLREEQLSKKKKKAVASVPEKIEKATEDKR